MKIKSYIGMIVACSGLIMTSCSDSSDWAPGPADDECGVSAYFPDQTTRYIYASDEDPDAMVITVTVKRVDTASAVSIPLTSTTSATGFEIPAAVNFEAGEAEATFDVNCGGIPQGEMQSFTVALDPAQTDTYGPGVSEMKIEAIVSDWTLISDNVTYYYFDSGYQEEYPNTYGEMYHLKGTYMFRFSDFFGSGLDMPFEVSTPSRTGFVPTGNCMPYYYDDGTLNWYFYDDAISEYPDPWIPGGDQSKTGIEYAMIYGPSDYTNITMIYNSSTLYGYADICINYCKTDGVWTWAYNQIDFNLIYNPFE